MLILLFCYSALWSSSTFFIPSSTCVLCLLVPCCCRPTSSSLIYSQRLRPPSRKCFAAIAKFAIQTWSYSSAPSSISSFLPLLAQMSWLVSRISAKLFLERRNRVILQGAQICFFVVVVVVVFCFTYVSQQTVRYSPVAEGNFLFTVLISGFHFRPLCWRRCLHFQRGSHQFWPS